MPNTYPHEENLTKFGQLRIIQLNDEVVKNITFRTFRTMINCAETATPKSSKQLHMGRLHVCIWLLMQYAMHVLHRRSNAPLHLL